MTDWKVGLSWTEIQFELDTNDESVASDNKNYADSVKKELQEEWAECSFHHIKHHGVAGDCPLCSLRTCFEEKQRIGENID